MKPESPLQWHDPVNVTKTLQRTNQILRGNISYGSMNNKDVGRNISVYAASFATVGGTEVPVNHKLNRIPIGFHVIRKNGTTDVYDSGTPWTKTQIFVKSSTVGNIVSILIF